MAVQEILPPAAAEPPPGRVVPTGRRSRNFATLGLVSAPVGYLILFFLVPVVLIGIYSFGGISGLVP
ncbi:MAG: hypothetical protein ACXVQJ_10000, partial [Actinomycetota bacterium]